jgi:hypothetical protein
MFAAKKRTGNYSILSDDTFFSRHSFHMQPIRLCTLANESAILLIMIFFFFLSFSFLLFSTANRQVSDSTETNE